MNKEKRLIKSLRVPELKTPISKDLFLPNHSGQVNGAILPKQPVFDDQQVILGSVGFGSSAPTKVDFNGAEVLSFANNQSNEINFIMQLSHKYRLGSDVEFHIHTVTPGETSGDVRWQLTVSKADFGDPFTSPVTFLGTHTVDCNECHELFDFETIGQAQGVSSLWLMSLTRLGSDARDTLPGVIYLIALDAHIEIDSLGSRTEYIK